MIRGRCAGNRRVGSRPGTPGCGRPREGGGRRGAARLAFTRATSTSTASAAPSPPRRPCSGTGSVPGAACRASATSRGACSPFVPFSSLCGPFWTAAPAPATPPASAPSLKAPAAVGRGRRPSPPPQRRAPPPLRPASTARRPRPRRRLSCTSRGLFLSMEAVGGRGGRECAAAAPRRPSTPPPTLPRPPTFLPPPHTRFHTMPKVEIALGVLLDRLPIELCPSPARPRPWRAVAAHGARRWSGETAR